nr:hypothetical protein [Leptospira noguchii]
MSPQEIRLGKYNSDLKKIEDYLKQGADVHCKTGEFGGRDEWGNSPMHIAVKEGESISSIYFWSTEPISIQKIGKVIRLFTTSHGNERKDLVYYNFCNKREPI